MKQVWKAAACLLAVMAFGVQAQETDWQEGRHYEELATPVTTSTGDKVEVAEVFWYGCPHCYAFKPLIEEWKKDLPEDVEYVGIPAALGRTWEPHARAYYTLQALGKLDQTHDAMFEALARDRRQLDTAEALADYLSDYGVDEEAFIKTFNSFGVNAKMQQAQAKIRGARITGTPSLLIDGKYVVTGSMAGSHENMLKVADYLISKERAE